MPENCEWNMRRLDHRARPSAEQINKVLAACNQLNSTITGISGLAPVVGINAYMFKELIWPESAYAARCDTLHQYWPLKGSQPMLGLSNGTSQVMWDRATSKVWDWYWSIWMYGQAYREGYGHFDNWPYLTADDMTLTGADAFQFATLQINFETEPPSLEGTGFDHDIWSATSGGAKPCEHAGDWLRWKGMSSDPQTSYYTGPYWSCGIADGGVYVNDPYNGLYNTGMIPNMIGNPVDPDSNAVVWNSSCCVDGGATFGFPYVLQRIPSGSTIIDAKLEVKVSGLTRRHVTTTRSVDEYGEWTINTDVDEALEDISLVLVGGTCNGRLIEYGVIAGAGVGIDRNDAWSVCDVTGLCQTMIDSLRGSSKISRMALVPSISADIIGVTDMRGYLSSIFPTVELSVHVAPSNTTQWWDPNTDFWYVSYEEGTMLSWSSVQLGNIAITWQLPSGEQHREVIPWSLPPMH